MFAPPAGITLDISGPADARPLIEALARKAYAGRGCRGNGRPPSSSPSAVTAGRVETTRGREMNCAEKALVRYALYRSYVL
jgi:hypothetical protein